MTEHDEWKGSRGEEGGKAVEGRREERKDEMGEEKVVHRGEKS